ARRADLLGSPASATLLFAAELEDARDRLRDALRDDPQNFEAHVLMARTLRPLLETDAARRAAEAALRLRPADPDALWEAILLDVHRFELAQGDAYDVDFSGTRTLGPVATVRYVESMSPEQHAALEKIRSDISALAAGLPPSRAAHARAFLQRLEGRYEDALASCEAALAEDPHLFEALRLRASILAALRRPEALAAHRVLSSVLPEDPFLLLTLADLEDSLPAGMLAIDRAERLFSSPDLARYHRATLLLRFDRPREAAAIARALTRENPLYGPNWEVLHVAGYLLGDWEEADAALVSWGEQGGQLQPIWWSVAGSRHAEMGRFGEAVEAFARAVEMAPGFAVCRWGLGRSRILNGEVARGVEDLFDAVAAGNLDDRARRALEAQRATMEKSVKKLKTPREQAKFAEGIAFLLRMSLAEDAPPERTEQYGASIATLHNLAFALYEKAGAWKDALRLIPTASLPGVDRPWMPDYRIARIEAAQGRAAQAAQALRAARDRGMESLGAVRGHPAFAAFLKSPEHAELEKEFAEPR
ncbi:MAG: tetratricopeptide repeat protein, partial [Candidatus Brocadiae bacterium]|nr:tetratricopeptide repeat protein [Candidatus Brocadiia bacterium]